jgi:hypothetical protein
MVVMVVRNHDQIDVLGTDLQLVHVLQQKVCVCPGIEENALLSARNNAREPPARPTSLGQGIIVIENGDLYRSAAGFRTGGLVGCCYLGLPMPVCTSGGQETASEYFSDKNNDTCSAE